MFSVPMMHWISVYRSHPVPSFHTWDLRPSPALPPSGHGTWGSPSPGPLSPCQWHLVAMTRDLFKLVQFRAPPPVLTSRGETCTIGSSGQYTSYWNDFLSFMFSKFGCDWNKCAAIYCKASDTAVFLCHPWCQCMKVKIGNQLETGINHFESVLSVFDLESLKCYQWWIIFTRDCVRINLVWFYRFQSLCFTVPCITVKDLTVTRKKLFNIKNQNSKTEIYRFLSHRRKPDSFPGTETSRPDIMLSTPWLACIWFATVINYYMKGSALALFCTYRIYIVKLLRDHIESRKIQVFSINNAKVTTVYYYESNLYLRLHLETQ